MLYDINLYLILMVTKLLIIRMRQKMFFVLIKAEKIKYIYINNIITI